jgi:predicted dinucleotide-binding enzyme
MVGTTIGSKLVALGHEVKLGSRAAGNEKALAWLKSAGAGASEGTFADAAAFGELAFNCTSGAGALPALESAKRALDGKILVDVSNPLDFSKGMPPTLFVGNDDSLGERIQRALPETKVVKTLNTVNCQVMVDAARVAGGDHDMFVCGNDGAAKGRVTEILRGWFGWKNVLDLGDIGAARATEAYLHLWLRLYGFAKSADFNIKLVR